MNDNDTGMSPMRVACVQLHEMYVELQRAGFKRREALSMVTAMLLSGVNSEDE